MLRLLSARTTITTSGFQFFGCTCKIDVAITHWIDHICSAILPTFVREFTCCASSVSVEQAGNCSLIWASIFCSPVPNSSNAYPWQDGHSHSGWYDVLHIWQIPNVCHAWSRWYAIGTSQWLHLGIYPQSWHICHDANPFFPHTISTFLPWGIYFSSHCCANVEKIEVCISSFMSTRNTLLFLPFTRGWKRS